MKYEFCLPDVGEGITESDLLKWHVKPGDVVREDDLLCEIETDKAVVEISVPCSGTVLSLPAAEGNTVKVGSVIAVFDTADTGAIETMAKAAAPAAVSASSAVSSAPTFKESTQAVAPQPLPAQPVHATPSTRSYARQQGVALETISGSGPKGRILHEDIDRHVASTTAKALDTSSVKTDAHPLLIPIAGQQRRTPFKGLRRTIADTMVRSVSVIPHATSTFRCNAEAFVALRPRLQEHLGCRISFTAMVIKAMIPALRRYPYFNASIDDANSEIVEHGDINIGFATHTGEGLMVPVIKHADQKSLAEISTEIDHLASLARERKIGLADLKGGTITLSNVGSHGTHGRGGGRPIIRHPETAIIVMGRIKPQPVVVNGVVVAQQSLDMVTSCDHRLIDGIYASDFMEAIIAVIEDPGLLLGL